MKYLRYNACKDQSLNLFGIKRTGIVTAFKTALVANLRLNEIYWDVILFYMIWLVSIDKESQNEKGMYFVVLSVFMFS